MEIKAEMNKWGLIPLNLLTQQRKYKLGEITTLRMGQNNSKETTDNLQNIQAAYASQYQKNNLIKK